MNGSIIYTIGSGNFRRSHVLTTASTLRTSFAKRGEGLSNVPTMPTYISTLSTFAWSADGQYNNID